mgnify:CR=1 FL=1
MRTSTGALREGVLYDLIGRLRHEDVRERSIQAIMQRYNADEETAQLVARRARLLFDATRKPWDLKTSDGDLLERAALAHEIGMAISHKHFHHHGAYLLRNSDLPGFSQSEQEQLAAIVAGQRGKLRSELLDSVADIDAATDAAAGRAQSAEDLAQVWTSASQVTLVTAQPPPGAALQAANFRDAQAAARDTLESIRKIRDRTDDLAQLQILLADALLDRGMAGPGTRLVQLAAGARQGVKSVMSYRLFYIGDTPISLGSLFKFLVIIVLGFLLSWLIRRMLQRLQMRRERLAAIGQTVAGRSHVLKNVLNGLRAGQYVLDRALQKVVIGMLADHTELFKQFSDNPLFRKSLSDANFARTYGRQ